MPSRHIQPSRVQSGRGVPEVIEVAIEASANFQLGAPLQRNSVNSNEFEEFAGGATVTGLVGFALQDVVAGVADIGAKIQVAKASQSTEFFGQVRDTGGNAVREITGDGSFEGNSYGLIEVSNIWYVDEDDVTNVHVIVTRELPDVNGVLFKVIGTVQAD